MSKNDMTLPLEAEKYYHIYNRGNGGINLFYSEENYKYFLRKYAEKMKDYWETYAYCLLPNHFHILIKVKPRKEIFQTAANDLKTINKKLFEKLFPEKDIKKNKSLLNIHCLLELDNTELQELVSPFTKEVLEKKMEQWIISEKFRRFMLGYAKAINSQEERCGSIFQKLYRRKVLDTTESFKNVMAYIHRNGVHHSYCEYIDDYKWSSYMSVLSTKNTLLNRDESLYCFGGREEFVKFHQTYIDDWKLMQNYIIED